MRWIDYREALGVSFSDSDKANMLACKIILFKDNLDKAKDLMSVVAEIRDNSEKMA